MNIGQRSRVNVCSDQDGCKVLCCVDDVRVVLSCVVGKLACRVQVVMGCGSSRRVWRV